MLKRCLSIAAVRKALAAPLPKSLDETYDNILSGIDDAYQAEVMRTLQAVTVAVDHLTLEQVVEILAVDLDSQPPRFDIDARLLDPRNVLSMCSSLITSFKPRVWVNQTLPLALRLAHASVADFLTQPGSNTLFHFTISSARQTMAQICLVYLLNPTLSAGHNRATFEQRLREYPFLRHAALYWPMYLDTVESDPTDWSVQLSKETKQLIKALFDTRHMPNGGNFACWIGQLIPSSSDDIIQSTQPLYYAASFGLLEVVRFILDTEPNVDIDALGGRASSPALHVAVYRDHIDVVRLLLKRGADPNIPNVFDECPLEWATMNENRDMAKLLVEYGARSSPASVQRRVAMMEGIESLKKSGAFREELARVSSSVKGPL